MPGSPKPKGPKMTAGWKPASSSLVNSAISKLVPGGQPASPPGLTGNLASEYAEASQKAKAATPGNIAPPFKRSEDLFSENEFNNNIAQQILGAKQSLAAVTTENRFQQGQVNQAAKSGAQATDWNAAGRGIFQSSIRQNALNDIEANRSAQENRLQDQINNQASQNLALMGANGNGLNPDGTPDNSIIGQAIARFRAAMNQKQVENAAPLTTAGDPGQAAGPPPKEWFLAKIKDTAISDKDRAALRAQAVSLGYAKWVSAKKQGVQFI